MTCTHRKAFWVRWIQFFILAVSISLPGLPAAKDKRELVVMTQNLYLGASLEPAIRATTAEEFLIAVATIDATVQFTNFPVRAAGIAQEIALNAPDIIGLQEVTEWLAVGPVTHGSQDFLAILAQELDALNLHYQVVAVSHNAEIGPVPLVGPACTGGFGTCYLWLKDRDVILVKQGLPGLNINSTLSGQYASQLVVDTPVGPLTFNRGWTYFDGTFQGKKLRFVNTHLEEESWPAIQEAQAGEFLAGPAKAGGAVIAVGDFNSAADGSNTGSYALLTKSYFRDAWNVNASDPGYTCCQDATLTNPNSLLYERIDLILTHAASRTLDARLVNDVPFINGDQPPLWPSDHAGIVAKIRIH